MDNFYHEITPLTANDCFMVFDRQKPRFDFPIHYHEEYELTYIENAAGARRIVGDSIEEIKDYDLVFVGSNLPHGWVGSAEKNKEIHEVTIQFHKDLLDEKLLNRNQLSFIRSLLDFATRGVKFSESTIMNTRPKILELSQTQGFNSVLALIQILHNLSISDDLKMLSSSTFSPKQISLKSRRIEKVFEFMRENYDKEITLADLAKQVSMAEVSLSRFIKQRTGFTFIDSLNNIRLGHASRLLIDTTMNIAEVSYKCGFNNLSYFNRVFKKKHRCTPKEFRKNYTGTRVFV